MRGRPKETIIEKMNKIPSSQICTSCFEEKYISFFYKANKFRYHRACKDCQYKRKVQKNINKRTEILAYHREYYKNHPRTQYQKDKIKTKNKERYLKTKNNNEKEKL